MIVKDLQDRGAYRIVIAAIGCALIFVLIGICAIVAIAVAHGEWQTVHRMWTKTVGHDKRYWHLSHSRLTATTTTAVVVADGKREVPRELWLIAGALAGGLFGILARQPSEQNLVPFTIVLVAFGVSLGFGIAQHSLPLQVLAAASGGALLGLLAPSPIMSVAVAKEIKDSQ